jgi:hypothetical protein
MVLYQERIPMWIFPPDDEEDKEGETKREREDRLIIDEKREVIRNQLEVIKHQRRLGMTLLRLTITLASLILGFVITVLIFRRNEVLNIISDVRDTLQDAVAEQFFVSIIILFTVFLFFLGTFIYNSYIKSMKILYSNKSEWDLDTSRDISNKEATEDIAKEIIKNQNHVIEKNRKSINENEPLLADFAESGTHTVASFFASLIILAIIYLLNQQGALSDSNTGVLLLVTGLLGIPFTLAILERRSS